jgi:hypothetical protein
MIPLAGSKIRYQANILDQNGIAFDPEDPLVAGGTFTPSDTDAQTVLAQEGDGSIIDVTPGVQGTETLTVEWVLGSVSLQATVELAVATRVPTSIELTQIVPPDDSGDTD